jgi:hypothetical protein
MANEEKRGVRITQQFRERHNMTYELECSGAPLIVRVFPLDEGDPPLEWRIEARVSDSSDAVVASATAPSRAVALERIAEWWRANAVARALGPFDWNAIAQAMTAVRAI